MAENGYKSGLVSYVRNAHTKKKYCISTAQETGKSYWSSVVMPCGFFGLISDMRNREFTFIRKNKEDSCIVHAELQKIVASSPRNVWIQQFPEPQSLEGWNEKAKAGFKRSGL